MFVFVGFVVFTFREGLLGQSVQEDFCDLFVPDVALGDGLAHKVVLPFWPDAHGQLPLAEAQHRKAVGGTKLSAKLCRDGEICRKWRLGDFDSLDVGDRKVHLIRIVGTNGRKNIRGH